MIASTFALTMLLSQLAYPPTICDKRTKNARGKESGRVKGGEQHSNS